MDETPQAFTSEHAGEDRRGFLKKALSVVIGGIVVVVPAAAGLFTFFDPVRRKGGAASFIKVATLDAIPADGSPRKFQVIADKSDAWNHYRGVAIGAVYVRRTNDGVIAFNVVCPHAGCFVDVAPDNTFKCPCHNSTFKDDGSLGEGSVSPRPLDTLEIDKDALKQGIVSVKFMNFRAGAHDKIPQV